MKILSKRKIAICILSIFCASLVLGAFSIRPFTKLYLPLVMFNGWYRVAYPSPKDEVCLSRLTAQGAEFYYAEVPQKDIDLGCIIDTTVVVSKLGVKLTNISFPPQADYVAMSCDMAIKLQKYIQDILVPISKQYFGSMPVQFLHKGGYSCRGQRSFTTIKSEHSYGQAIDFAGVVLEDGREILVEKSYFENTEKGLFLREMAKRGCIYFGTSLTPNFDALHDDHLHWSTGFPYVCK